MNETTTPINHRARKIAANTWRYRGHTIMTTRTRGTLGYAVWWIYPPADQPGLTYQTRVRIPPRMEDTPEERADRLERCLALATLKIDKWLAKHE